MVAAPLPLHVVPTADGALAPILQLRSITKHFPVQRRWSDMLRHPRRREQVRALMDVSLDVHEGEFFGLLGPNGAGKSTLFRILSTLVSADAGSGTVCGFDVVRDADRVREVLAPVIADERSLNWRLSARENLRLYATLHGLRGAARLSRIDELLELVELLVDADRPVSGFSSGMKQRLLIARTLLARPRVLLLDEPTRSLDPLSARRFREFLRREVAHAQGCTVLLATHNAEEALHFCDRVGVLERGQLIAVGPAGRLASELGDERYALWVRESDPARFDMLVAPCEARRSGELVTTSDGWNRVEMEIPGGPDAAARVLDALARAGVAVARCERLELSLADLLERLLARHAQSRGLADA
jgi:ABC-2 type transport system ATP-binding protein